MKCLHENTLPHQEDWDDEQGRTISDSWVECLDCGEEFTPAEWDREQADIEAEREQVNREHEMDRRFHRWQEDQVA